MSVRDILEKLCVATASIMVGTSICSSALGATITNGIVSIGVNVTGTKGGSIESLKVVGIETLNVADLGREAQASIFVNSSLLPPQGANCQATLPIWLNPQDGGDQCNTPSQVYAIGTSGSTVHVGSYPRDYAGRGPTPGLRIEGHHTVGPLPYLNAPEVVQMKYQVYWDNAAGRGALPTMHYVYDGLSRQTPVPFLPATYFKGDLLTRLYGLSVDGSTWVDLTSSVSTRSDGTYAPSLYRFRAMAWMRSDMGWGVGLYGRWTLNSNCSTNFGMALTEQSGQCPNFAAQRFFSGGSSQTNNLSLVDQSLAKLAPGTGQEFIAHFVVGNLDTIRSYVNALFAAGY